jgi:hypothetical protein
MGFQEHTFKILVGFDGLLKINHNNLVVGSIDDNQSIKLTFERPAGFEDYDLELFLSADGLSTRIILGPNNTFDLNRPYTLKDILHIQPSFFGEDGYKRSAGIITLYFGDIIPGGEAPVPPWPDPITIRQPRSSGI